jgi:hypothetical protein
MEPGPAFPPACTGAAICTAATGQRATPGTLPAGPDGSNAQRALAALAGYYWRDGHLKEHDHYGAICCADNEIVADWNDEASHDFTEVKTTLIDAATEWDQAHPAVTP